MAVDRIYVSDILYAKSGDVNIAYEIRGEGPFDLVYVPGWISNLEAARLSPEPPWFDRLARFCRLIRFDKRGTGMSDRVSGTATLEQRIDDVRAVMEAADSRAAALFGVSEGGPMSMLFAATYPERTRALVLYGSYPRRVAAPDYPWAPTVEWWRQYAVDIERHWGTDAFDIELRLPSKSADAASRAAYLASRRRAASPGAARAIAEMNGQIDVRHVLPTIRVPTLILHVVGDRMTSVEGARYMARLIPNAKLVEVPGIDHSISREDAERYLVPEMQEFLTGERPTPESTRMLTTALFTDIVEGTKIAANLGDARWRELMERHHAIVRESLSRYRGVEMDTAGDGFFATFDGPARAIRCALSVRDELDRLGIQIRAGLHTGECEMIAGKAGGIGIITAARVRECARPGEVLVSSTVRDLVAGSGITFAERGTQLLKGVPGQWPLFAAS